MKSSALTVDQYLKELPDEKRVVISEIRKMILHHLPHGYQETMNWGMISYEVPLSTFPHTYNNQPLMYAALASQKNYYALYLMSVYSNPDLLEKLENGFIEEGKTVNMGKSCIRFKTVDDLPMDVLGEIIAAVSVEQFCEMYKQNRK